MISGTPVAAFEIAGIEAAAHIGTGIGIGIGIGSDAIAHPASSIIQRPASESQNA
jgi:hypothetical protein